MAGQNNLEIAVFGDSFSCRNDRGYLKILSDRLPADLINFSKPGAGLDYTWGEIEKYLMTNKNNPDIVIITLTSSDRPYHPYFTINASGVYDYQFNVNPPKELEDAAKAYYMHMLSEEGSNIKKSMFETALKYLILSNQHIKFILLPCFDPLFLYLDSKNYRIMDHYLMKFHTPDDLSNNKIYINHLNDTNNEILGQAIVNLIKTWKLSNSNRFDVEFLEP